MYTYYGLTAAGYKIRGKPIITAMQISQFVGGFVLVWDYINVPCFHADAGQVRLRTLQSQERRRRPPPPHPPRRSPLTAGRRSSAGSLTMLTSAPSFCCSATSSTWTTSRRPRPRRPSLPARRCESVCAPPRSRDSGCATFCMREVGGRLGRRVRGRAARPLGAGVSSICVSDDEVGETGPHSDLTGVGREWESTHACRRAGVELWRALATVLDDRDTARAWRPICLGLARDERIMYYRRHLRDTNRNFVPNAIFAFFRNRHTPRAICISRPRV